MFEYSDKNLYFMKRFGQASNQGKKLILLVLLLAFIIVFALMLFD